MNANPTHSAISHTEVVNKRGTTVRVGQQWADNSPTRHLTIEAIEETYGHRQAICRITHGTDRTTGEQVPIDRVVRIDVDRLHPVRTGYRQVAKESDLS
ncbi:hypothetical protein SIM91_05125 [Rhodococcus opacus]|uniref:hypothetical protein n=1 Tax=Rhodococcus opacus TaxID=37919 RepID=UPI0002A20736|nr:hypothetical protein [Rhodococcus opacus]ELB86020.1 hypothetical protein Rwratislav_47170 [Rhodococcus wratislaviensis IFP 2016]MDX5962705.1 hypothetical protein [Rhodococcus opacus]CAG7636651.1 hypothetical protein E143388_07815 [Rhodococcus opacus]